MDWFKKKATQAKQQFQEAVEQAKADDVPMTPTAIGTSMDDEPILEEQPTPPSAQGAGREGLENLSKEELIAMLLQQQQTPRSSAPRREPRVYRSEEDGAKDENGHPIYLYDSSAPKPRRPASPILRFPGDRKEGDWWPEGEDRTELPPDGLLPREPEPEEYDDEPRDRDHIPREPLHTRNQISLQLEAIANGDGVVARSWNQPGVTFEEHEKHPDLLNRFAAALMANETLQTLGMDWMEINDDYLATLFPPGIKLASVQYLVLASNKITNQGVTSFVKMLEAGGFANVEVIGFSNNRITGVDSGIYDLADVIKSGRLSKLRWMHLQGNDIHDHSKEQLESACKERNVRLVVDYPPPIPYEDLPPDFIEKIIEEAEKAAKEDPDYEEEEIPEWLKEHYYNDRDYR